MFKVIVYAFFIGVLSAIAPATFANASFESRKISQITLHDWGKILISFKGGLKTSEPCENKRYIVLKKDNQYAAEMYSALLAAYHAGSLVSGWVNNCDDRMKAPILTRLDLLPKN